MVQIDIEKHSGYRVVTSGDAMPAGDKQQPVAAVKVSSRELRYKTRDVSMNTCGKSPITEDGGLVLDVAKTRSKKRQHPSCSSNSSSPVSPHCTDPHSTSTVNGFLVYARTKARKMAFADTPSGAYPHGSPKTSIDVSKEPILQHERIQENDVSPAEITPAPPSPLTTSLRDQLHVSSSPEKPAVIMLLEPILSVSATSADPPSSVKSSSDGCGLPDVRHESTQESMDCPSAISPPPLNPVNSSGEDLLVLSIIKPKETVLPELEHPVATNNADHPIIKPKETVLPELEHPVATNSADHPIIKPKETVLPELEHPVATNSADHPSPMEISSDESRESNGEHDPTGETVVSPAESTPAPPSPLNSLSCEPSPVSSFGKPTEIVLPEQDHAFIGNNAGSPSSEKANSEGSMESDVQYVRRQVTTVSTSEIAPSTPCLLDSLSEEAALLLSLGNSADSVLPEADHSVNANSSDPPNSRKDGFDSNREFGVRREPTVETKVSSSDSAHVPLNLLNTSSGEPSVLLSFRKPTEDVLPERNHSKGVSASHDPSVSSAPGKPTEGVLPQPNLSKGTNATADPPRPSKPSGQDWKSRFIQLQMFLKKCDQSNHEEYIQSLRALPASARSRYAIELERRALQLSLDEAKEYQKMKYLGILEKESSTGLNINLDQFSRAKLSRG